MGGRVAVPRKIDFKVTAEERKPIHCLGKNLANALLPIGNYFLASPHTLCPRSFFSLSGERRFKFLGSNRDIPTF